MLSPGGMDGGRDAGRSGGGAPSALADTAVAVVLFRPAPEQVERVLARFRGGVPALLAFDNGGIPDAARAAMRDAGVRLLGEGANLGIAAGLNALAAAAAGEGCRYLLLLDQDADMSLDTLRTLRAAMGRLARGPEPAAVVGPAPAPTTDRKAPRYPARPGIAPFGSLVPVEFLATSGSLLDLSAFARVGPFREDYFIDAVELEWCFRAWARGLTCWMETGAAIAHSVGGGVIRAPFLPVAMPRQPLFRMAAYVRNTCYGLTLPHVPGRWKRRQAAYLPLQIALYWWDGGFRPAVLRRLLSAAVAGLRGRLGRPDDAPP